MSALKITAQIQYIGKDNSAVMVITSSEPVRIIVASIRKYAEYTASTRHILDAEEYKDAVNTGYISYEMVEKAEQKKKATFFEVKWVHTGKFEALYRVKARSQEEADAYVEEHRLKLEPISVVGLCDDYEQYI
jgi:hypothetical protein